MWRWMDDNVKMCQHKRLITDEFECILLRHGDRSTDFVLELDPIAFVGHLYTLRPKRRRDELPTR